MRSLRIGGERRFWPSWGSTSLVQQQEAPLVATDRLVVAPSPIHGTGVFARRPFEPGDVIESCPVIVCGEGEEALLEQTQLRGLYFHWDEEGAVAIALGFGSLYNHAWSSNARYEADGDEAVIRFVCVRPIEPGDEVTINYTGSPDGIGELWFDAGPPPEAPTP
jgi:SET domain-containing protein